MLGKFLLEISSLIGFLLDGVEFSTMLQMVCFSEIQPFPDFLETFP